MCPFLIINSCWCVKIPHFPLMPLMCFYESIECFLLKKTKQVVKMVNFFDKTDLISVHIIYTSRLVSSLSTLCQQGWFPGILQEQRRNKVQPEHDEGSKLHTGQVAKLCCTTQMAHDLPHKKVCEDWSSTACATIFALWMAKTNEDFPCFNKQETQKRW